MAVLVDCDDGMDLDGFVGRAWLQGVNEGILRAYASAFRDAVAGVEPVMMSYGAWMADFRLYESRLF